VRRVVLPLLALALTVGACGTESAPVASAPTSAPTTEPDDSFSAADLAHQDWLAGGPMATSMPTRTCVTHEPTDEELATTDPGDQFAYSDLSWSSCFDPGSFWTEQPQCTPPADLPEDGTYACGFYGSPLTQRVVDDWNAFADREDTAAARRQGLTLEEYRAQYPDTPS
jgi:hypothetical protein